MQKQNPIQQAVHPPEHFTVHTLSHLSDATPERQVRPTLQMKRLWKVWSPAGAAHLVHEAVWGRLFLHGSTPHPTLVPHPAQ